MTLISLGFFLYKKQQKTLKVEPSEVVIKRGSVYQKKKQNKKKV